MLWIPATVVGGKCGKNICDPGIGCYRPKGYSGPLECVHHMNLELDLQRPLQCPAPVVPEPEVPPTVVSPVLSDQAVTTNKSDGGELLPLVTFILLLLCITVFVVCRVYKCFKRRVPAGDPIVDFGRARFFREPAGPREVRIPVPAFPAVSTSASTSTPSSNR